MKEDMIYRHAAIDALWKALFEYEDKTEKQFLESDELDLSDWMIHRIFVQNMSDIDRETILNLPSAQPEQQWMPCSEKLPEEDGLYLVTTSKGQVQAHVFSHNGNSEEYWMRCNKAWMPMPEAYGGQEDE